MQALTDRQAQVHAYMLAYQREHGMPPTLQEIAFFLKGPTASRAGPYWHLTELVKKGAVSRAGGSIARGWRAIPLPGVQVEALPSGLVLVANGSEVRLNWDDVREVVRLLTEVLEKEG